MRLKRSLAERALEALSRPDDGVLPFTSGTVAALIESMDRCGIDKAVLANIATKPEQFDSIMTWSRELRSDRIIPLPSIHPADPLAETRIRHIADEGFKGLKLHPYYQDFRPDAPEMNPIYEATRDAGLILLCHAGFDIAFPRDVQRCEPTCFAKVLKRFPGLKLQLAHFGGWYDWDQVEEHILGRDVHVDLAVVRPFMPADRFKRFLLTHPADRILFGTDTPWSDQKTEIEAIHALGLEADLQDRILGSNAARFYGV